MKKVILSFLFLSLSFSSLAQTKKISPLGRIEVGILKKQPEKMAKEEEVKLFSLSAFKTIPQSSRVYQVSFSPQGEYLVFCTKEGKIGIYQIKKERLIKIKEEKVSKKPLYYVRFHPSKNIIAYGGRDEKNVIYDVEKNTKIHTILEFESPITDAIWTPDETVLCMAHLGTYGLTFYDTQNYEQLMNIKSPGGGIYHLAISGDSSLLAFASREKTISILPLGEKHPSFLLKKHLNLSLCVEFSPDDRFLASGGADGQLFLWKKEEDKIDSSPVFTWIHKNWVTSLKFFKNYLITSCKDGKIRIFDFVNKELLGVFEGSKNAIFTISIDKEGNFLAIGTKEEGVKIFKFKEVLEKIK